MKKTKKATKATKKKSKKKQIKKKEKKRQIRMDIHQSAFLAAFSGCGRVSKAAEIADIDRNDHYRWMKDDPGYPPKFEEARKKAIVFLEDVAVQRATDGWIEPVFYKGKPVGAVRRFSDNLLMFTLKGNAPEKYRERWDGHLSGDMTQTVEIVASGDGKKEEK